MRLGLFSVSYAGLWGQAGLDPPAFLDKAACLGFAAVLLMAKRPHLRSWTRTRGLDALRVRLEERKLTLIGLAAYDDFLVRLPAIPALELQLAYIEECARIAAVWAGGWSASSPATNGATSRWPGSGRGS